MKDHTKVFGSLFLVGVVIISGGLFLMFKPKPQQPAYQSCVKCKHLFVTGTGKEVLSWDNTTNIYCSVDAPKYDRVSIAWLGSNRNVYNQKTLYFVRTEPWMEVNEKGESLQALKIQSLESELAKYTKIIEATNIYINGNFNLANTNTFRALIFTNFIRTR